MIAIIAAMDKNGVIGKNGKLPWHLPADLKYFKYTTMYSSVVMGRKTFESIGKPLTNRLNIILTKNKDYKVNYNNCIVLHSLEEFFWYKLRRTMYDERFFVIGGAEIYKLFLPHADYLYITRINHEFDGDTYFPEIDYSQWELKSRIKGVVDEKNKYDHEFLVYKRIDTIW